jgi:hypothetical protein
MWETSKTEALARQCRCSVVVMGGEGGRRSHRLGREERKDTARRGGSSRPSHGTHPSQCRPILSRTARAARSRRTAPSASVCVVDRLIGKRLATSRSSGGARYVRGREQRNQGLWDSDRTLPLCALWRSSSAVFSRACMQGLMDSGETNAKAGPPGGGGGGGGRNTHEYGSSRVNTHLCAQRPPLHRRRQRPP